MSQRQAPPARGVRLSWNDIPPQVRAAVEQWLGSPVVSAVTQSTGFSPGVAVRLRTVSNHHVFVKAIGPEPNPDSPAIHRREGQIAALLPSTAPVPRLLWSYDDHADTGWVVLVFEDVEGHHPIEPWLPDELDRVLNALVVMTNILAPSPIPSSIVPTARDHFNHINGWQQLLDNQPTDLDEWSSRNLRALAEIESITSALVDGDTLLHFDVRADNILLTSDRVMVVDWPHACIGAAWIDIVCFAPSVTMQGGPPPEQIIAYHPICRQADSNAVTAVIISLAGYFTHRALQPQPPGLPTLRPFQAAQGDIAREWIARRTGWR